MNSPFRIKQLLLLQFAILLLSPPLSAKEKFSRTQVMMGDVPVTIEIVASAKKRAKAFVAMEKSYAEAKRIEAEVSEWQPTSQTSQINRMAGRSPVKIGKDLMAILLYAARASAGTDGAFDITFASRNRQAT